MAVKGSELIGRRSSARTAGSYSTFGEPHPRCSAGWTVRREPFLWQLRAKMLDQF